MTETFADRVPAWARSYAPRSDYFNESFVVVARTATFDEKLPVVSVKNEFTVKHDPNLPVKGAGRKSIKEFDSSNGVTFKIYSNTVTVNKSVGFFGVVIEAKNYKPDEVQYMRQFPTDSFSLGVVSLDKAGRSIHSQKLQYGKQIVVASQVLQLVTMASYLGQISDYEKLTDLSLDAINGRLYYPEIVADVSLLTVYQSCIMTFESQG